KIGTTFNQSAQKFSSATNFEPAGLCCEESARQSLPSCVAKNTPAKSLRIHLQPQASLEQCIARSNPPPQARACPLDIQMAERYRGCEQSHPVLPVAEWWNKDARRHSPNALHDWNR